MMQRVWSFVDPLWLRQIIIWPFIATSDSSLICTRKDDICRSMRWAANHSGRFLVSASEHSSASCHYFLSWMYRQQWWYLKMISICRSWRFISSQAANHNGQGASSHLDLACVTISWTGGKHFLGAMMATQKVIKTLILEFPKRFLGICQLLFEFR